MLRRTLGLQAPQDFRGRFSLLGLLLCRVDLLDGHVHVAGHWIKEGLGNMGCYAQERRRKQRERATANNAGRAHMKC